MDDDDPSPPHPVCRFILKVVPLGGILKAFKGEGFGVSVKRGLCKAIASSATKAQSEFYLEYKWSKACEMR